MTTDFKPAPPAPAQEAQDKYVGQDAYLTLGNLRVQVAISEIRNRYGNIDALVRPVAGSGQQWIQTTRLELAT